MNSYKIKANKFIFRFYANQLFKHQGRNLTEPIKVDTRHDDCIESMWIFADIWDLLRLGDQNDA